MDESEFAERLTNLLRDSRATEPHGLRVVNAESLLPPRFEPGTVLLHLDGGAVFEFRTTRTQAPFTDAD
jgi:hypothetical protein